MFLWPKSSRCWRISDNWRLYSGLLGGCPGVCNSTILAILKMLHFGSTSTFDQFQVEMPNKFQVEGTVKGRNIKRWHFWALTAGVDAKQISSWELNIRVIKKWHFCQSGGLYCCRLPLGQSLLRRLQLLLLVYSGSLPAKTGALR